MKVLTIIVRVLMGLMFLFASITYFFVPMTVPPMEGKVKIFNEGLAASGYLMNVVKTVELICGVLLVTGFYVPLAAVVIFPITLNIFLFHAFLAPQPASLGIAIALLIGNLYLFYAKRSHYAGLLTK